MAKAKDTATEAPVEAPKEAAPKPRLSNHWAGHVLSTGNLCQRI